MANGIGVQMRDGSYEATCRCGWVASGFETVEGAGEVLRLHLGDTHPDDEGIE